MEIKNKKRFVKWLWILAFSPVAMVLLALLCVGIFADIPSFEELEDPKSNLATQIISEDGTVINTFHIENRSYVTFDELSQPLKDAIVATEPESLEGTVTLDTLAGEMKGEYSATVANDGSVTVNYSFDNFNSVSEGGAGDVSSKKVGSVTRDADGNYTYTGDRVATAESVAGTVTSLKLDNSKLVNANISGNALSATVKSANTASVLGVALESDATFVLVINDGKVISFALAYEVEGASVEIVCEYK